jgi:anti-sigma regulatory factor (Ser/Thr protein kinase)
MGTAATTDRAHPRFTSAGGRSRLRRLRMAGDASALRDARRVVADTLAGAPEELRDAAVLLAGEILTNAVVHGGGWFLLQVDAGPDVLYVEVADSTAGHPRVLHPNSEREHGRGMAIVDAMASAWGTKQRGSHKVVWFELALGPSGKPRVPPPSGPA